MIAFLKGTLVRKKPTSILLDVRDVGYELSIPMSTFEQLPKVGEKVTLLTHHHVREDAESLFGFFSSQEKEIFVTLISVSGIGPRIALAALSSMRPQQIRDYIVNGEVGMMTSVPGIGKKTAERMIVELRDKLSSLYMTPAAGATGSSVSNGAPSARADALSALEALGLSRAAAEKSLNKALQRHPDATSVEEMVRLALRDK